MMKMIVGGLAAAAVALGAAGVAHADSNDDHLVQVLNNAGVTGAPADLINNAHQVCSNLDEGHAPGAIRDAFISQMGFTSSRAATFVAVSVSAYCPKYSNLRF